MFDKLSDTANILQFLNQHRKAKITKDELEEKLVLATSEQNWQTPTNILHQISNAAFNYEKWQKINDFIWEKLKKKTTWRKIVKTLNLVQFLIKNGPPSAVSSFKYDIYQFRSFSDYQAFHEGIDRGQSIREKAKQIVDLLSNQQHLEQQREKAKKIRQKMSNITGVGNYGGYGSNYGNTGSGDGKYGSYNNKTYTQKNTDNNNYGKSDFAVGLGAYGDYNYNKSTLDKYKDKQKGNNTTANNKGSNTNIPDITGGRSITNSITENQNTEQVTKKPFQKIAPKLVKPNQKNTTNTTAQTKSPNLVDIIGGSTTNQKANNNNNSNNNNGLDIFNVETTTTTTPTTNNYNNNNTINNGVNNNGVSVGNGNNNSNGANINLGQNTQQTQVQPPQNNNTTTGLQNLNFNQIYNTSQPQPNFGLNQPYGYGQPYGQVFNQPYSQPYGQPYGQPFLIQGYPNQYGQPYPQPYSQPGSYPTTYSQPQTNPTSFSMTSFTTPVQPIQPVQPVQPISQQTTQITMQTKKQQDDFGKFQSAPSQSTANVKWLSQSEKGLIDLSDFSNQIKNISNSPKKVKQQKNRIEIDPWKW